MTDFKLSHKYTIESGTEVPGLSGNDVVIFEDGRTYVYENISDSELIAFEEWAFVTFEGYTGKEIVRENRRIWVD
ncbi:hypothetical protein [Kiloniella laminariae]|uniref:hypothetical protein n=1 Tax=Kiloniella laminariae TaxID=454162 RepID=UPI000365E6B6|nr:hypothetical protein [Kiloniella laminariae]